MLLIVIPEAQAECFKMTDSVFLTILIVNKDLEESRKSGHWQPSVILTWDRTESWPHAASIQTVQQAEDSVILI